MVALNFTSNDWQQRHWALTVQGDADDYLTTIRALLHVLAAQDADLMSKEDNYTVLTLIEAMLPEKEQLVSR